MNKQEFINNLKTHNIELNEKTLEKLDTYYDFLVSENKKYNLTSLTNYEEVLEKHFYDSISILFNRKLEGTTVDVGSGGGFPGVPLKVIDESIDLTCLDATAKKMNFINLLAEKLDIKVNTIVSRAEEAKVQFDNVVARGVASLNVLLELCANLVKENGYLIAMKGSRYEEELSQAKNAINKLGYELVAVDKYTLPTENALRANLIFKKVKSHPTNYPRNYSQIKKKPL